MGDASFKLLDRLADREFSDDVVVEYECRLYENGKLADSYVVSTADATKPWAEACLIAMEIATENNVEDGVSP